MSMTVPLQNMPIEFLFSSDNRMTEFRYKTLMFIWQGLRQLSSSNWQLVRTCRSNMVQVKLELCANLETAIYKLKDDILANSGSPSDPSKELKPDRMPNWPAPDDDSDYEVLPFSVLIWRQKRNPGLKLIDSVDVKAQYEIEQEMATSGMPNDKINAIANWMYDASPGDQLAVEHFCAQDDHVRLTKLSPEPLRTLKEKEVKTITYEIR